MPGSQPGILVLLDEEHHVVTIRSGLSYRFAVKALSRVSGSARCLIVGDIIAPVQGLVKFGTAGRIRTHRIWFWRPIPRLESAARKWISGPLYC